MRLGARICVAVAAPVCISFLMVAGLVYGQGNAQFYTDRANWAQQQINTLEQLGVTLDSKLVDVLLAPDPRLLMAELDVFEHDSLHRLGILDNQTTMELSFVNADERETEASERDRPAALRAELEELLVLTRHLLRARLAAEPTQDRSPDLAVLLERHQAFNQLVQDALADETEEIAAANAARAVWVSRQQTIVVAGLAASVAFALVMTLPLLRKLRRQFDAVNKHFAMSGVPMDPMENGERQELDRLAERVEHMVLHFKNASAQAHQDRKALAEKLERRTMEAELSNARLREIDQTRRRFLGDLGHALKTPLAVARGSVENLALAHQNLDSVPIDRALRAVDAVGARVAALIDLARSDDGQLIGQTQQIELFEFLDQRVAALRILPGGARISLTSHADGPTEVLCDAGDLERMCDAVLENAMEHSEGTGAINVTLDTHGQMAQITVRDHGPGLNGQSPKDLFARYNSSGKGHGIGLSMAHQIASDMGGMIELTTPVAGGFSVTVTLPIKSSRRAASDC